MSYLLLIVHVPVEKGHLSPLPLHGCPQRRGSVETLKWDYIGGYELNANSINKLLFVKHSYDSSFEK